MVTFYKRIFGAAAREGISTGFVSSELAVGDSLSLGAHAGVLVSVLAFHLDYAYFKAFVKRICIQSESE